jgi:hypothetical protein
MARLEELKLKLQKLECMLRPTSSGDGSDEGSSARGGPIKRLHPTTRSDLAVDSVMDNILEKFVTVSAQVEWRNKIDPTG